MTTYQTAILPPPPGDPRATYSSPPSYTGVASNNPPGSSQYSRFLEPKEITASPNPSLITCSLTKPARERKSARRVRPQGTDRPQSHQVHKTNLVLHHCAWTNPCFSFEQIDPPSSTLETTPDIVRLVGQRYEPRLMEWQRAVLWDFIQSRGAVHHEDLKERTYSQPEKLYLKRQSKKMAENPRNNNVIIQKLVSEDRLSNIFPNCSMEDANPGVRQCPGYSGFVPRTPTESDLAQRPQPTYMMSTMKANYRELPEEVYRKQTHARKGPLSRMVTLTYPFNPYNKV
uniref:Uncharacterized protein LOC111137733 n=1 Tax=Crassostrea virginica TaxID=6565 RepID=A0A8B8EYQ6_CRAVI|nr:uncharacterized protein LOC111137733 [Crassostrea virginica]